jgi:hypothetical protein
MNMKHTILLIGLVLAICLLPLSALAAPRQSGNPPATVQQGAGDNQAPSNQQVAPALTLPAGTLLTVRTTRLLSSDQNQPGDSFTSVLEQPLVAQGWVVSRRGQTVMGRVATAQKAGRVSGVSQLAVEMSELTLVDGQQLPIRTQLVQSSAGTSRGRDAGAIATTTGIGAVIGAAAGGGEGAAIGAAAGAAAGVAGVLTTRGRATELPAETVLTFRLVDPLAIDTQQSQQAFLPVTPQDYPDPGRAQNPERYPVSREYAPLPPYYYSPYGYPGYYGYYGYYGYGFGPRIYVGPGVFFGRGFGRRR